MTGYGYRESCKRIIQGIKNIATLITVYIVFIIVRC
jgi:hypothetical protein